MTGATPGVIENSATALLDQWIERQYAGGIFSIRPADGAVSDLHSFGPVPGPRKPFSLVEDAPGSLVVASRQGGAANLGTIFQLTPGNSPQVLHNFSDGGPYTSGATTFLTRASDGLLYGTRSNGGAEGGGSIFTLDGAGSYNELHAFDKTYPHYDSRPKGALIESRTEPGVFFGTLSGSGLDGSVYRIDSLGNLSYLAVLQSWDGSPTGSLYETEDGTLYGVIAEWSYINGYQCTVRSFARAPREALTGSRNSRGSRDSRPRVD